MKQYDFILTKSINGKPVELRLSGSYKDTIDFDAPTVYYNGQDVTDLMELVNSSSIGWKETLEEVIEGHIEYLMSEPGADVTTDMRQDERFDMMDIFKSFGQIFNPNTNAA